MRTGTLLNRTSLMFVGGLLVLAGVFSDGHRASAQTQEMCPLPAGGTPVAPPRVTAQQVENGTGSLMEFVLDARERSIEHARQATTAEQGLYIACLVREEGGPWRSGSTYVVSLTLDGRVYLHAKDMSLAGRLLNPLIYAEILTALGVSRGDVLNLASPDPATRNSAFAAVIATLSQEPEAPFDATVPIPGLRPGIPGASGHAAVYVSPELRSPIVLLAGFDINESHFAREDIDYGDPATTARDVVDRETLKDFVTEAGEYFLELQQSGDPAALSKARIALRDPNGPWRHGSVYLYVLDLESDLILFHAAFPDRFEYRPLVPTVRDAVTGKLVLPQVIEAATSGPEGGFVEYYFDDPTDDTDSADIPKVGYAREFKTDIVRSDGITVPLDLVIGSGFYPSSPSVAAARRNTVVESVLPQVMRAMTASTVDAVSGRIQQAASGAPPAKGFSLGGASTFSDALLTHGRALANDSFDPGRLLQGSSFTLPLNAAAKGRSGLLGNLTLWGSGDYRNLAGGNAQTVDYDGNVVSANLGIDTRVGENVLAGVSAGWARGTVDYTDSNAVTGELATKVTSVNPYVGVQTPGGVNLWATAGYGWGEVEIDDALAGTEASDLTQRMVAAGVRGPLVSSDELLKGGTTRLSLKGETAFTWADVDGSGALESMKLGASRQRLMLEGSHVRKLDSGGTFTPSIEVGMRYDGGDGETGSSIETGGGLRYTDSGSGLTIEGRARTVLAHSGDYEEWGVSGLLRLDPGAAGLGFSLSVQPAWGRTASGVQRMWETGVLNGLAGSDQEARVNARVGYGFGTAWGGRGVLTPYTGVSLSGEGSRRFSLGGQYRMGSSVTMSLEGVHSDPAHRPTSHGLMLRARLNW